MDKFKILFLVFYCLALFTYFFGLYLINDNGGQMNNENDKVVSENNLYQGPVPQGYDEDYFRKTGITRKLING